MRKLSGYGPSLIVLATAVLVLILGPNMVQELTYRQTKAQIELARKNLAGNTVLEQLNDAYRDIAAIVEPSVVHISAQQSSRDIRGLNSVSSGSGWVYDENGHIVTNYHVVKDVDRIDVQLSSGDLHEAQIVGYDPLTDIAVLKIAPGRLHPAVLGEPHEPVQQGDLVFAFGSPFDFRFSMSSGVVSGKGRSVGVIRDDRGWNGYENFIQVDAAINPGNSGGPLTDHRGHVIGMNTAIATSRGNSTTEGQFAGIGLAIPLEMIEPVVRQIIQKGYVEKGYLGVSVADVDADFRDVTGFSGEGVVVRRVDDDTPAAEAGLLPQDVILEVNGVAVTTRTQLQSHISSCLPGESVDLTVWRHDVESGENETLGIDVRLARLDELSVLGLVPEDQSTDRFLRGGIRSMRTNTRELARSFGLDFHPGVLVLELVPESDLARQIRPGTTIVSVGSEPVQSAEQFLDALRKHDMTPRSAGVRIGIIGPNGLPGGALLRVR
jgi:serine protease Do